MTQFKPYSKPKKLLHGTGDPTDDYLMFKDPNTEERYDEYCSENEVPNAISEYIASLERQNKAYRVGIKKVVSELPEHLTQYINQLNDILKV